MYPNSELRKLALRKQVVRLRTTLHRAQCENAGRQLAAGIDKAEYWIRTAKSWSGIAALLTTPWVGGKLMGRLFRRSGPAAPAAKPTRGKLGLAIDLGLLGWKAFRKFRSRPATYAGRGG